MLANFAVIKKVMRPVAHCHVHFIAEVGIALSACGHSCAIPEIATGDYMIAVRRESATIDAKL